MEELEDDDVDLIANVGSAAEELEHHTALTCKGLEDLLDEATREHDRELRRRFFVFVGRENAEASEHLKRKIEKSKGKRRALLKSEQKVHNALARNSVAERRDPNEFLVEVMESGEQVVMMDPRDYHLPAAPADSKFELPYEGDRYVGRKVRKAFRIRRKVSF